MKLQYCPTCGNRLTEKAIGDEGLMPYCEQCKQPVFDLVRPCVIALVVNEENEVALIQQDYIDTLRYVCVAGHMKSGESAEETVVREVEEEIGICPERIEYHRSYPYEKADLLMLGFYAFVKKKELKLSQEVQKAQWFSYEQAKKVMKENGIARQLMESYYKA